MIAYINGRVDKVDVDRAIIEVSGMGYELLCSDNTLRKLTPGTDSKLYVHFQVAQDAFTLFGFYDEEERWMFRRLISVSKIGPKTALSALSVLTPEDIAAAVLTDNVSAFDRVSGVGKKTAARLLLELKETMTDFGGYYTASDVDSHAGGASADASIRSEAVAALVALGYDGVTAGRTVVSVAQPGMSVEDMVLAALKSIPG
ncbi:MAG: Holliday junction branch migration protein RuvA [Clostridia bacterium]|nr:Holliday junction branch migration protein RuvA [Clostridia bacterium]